ncbi:hypothetical protein Misp01_41730 [Microtetraspora sp. NBRC 13810]|uniref:hypothetical protein n=1 Tax=Microtetraspora sp. NBRC 13810 TaxID=3030990 RepID=UPI002553D106|nr:hypothetical protein [Microtetraspora sp. NBRC 13810]GLW09044.1 hypothetical protein Misp01_41730 [Microtetraspora sp. NBRC 13810]
MTSDIFDGARDFLVREGRLLERRLFATLFQGAPAAGVVDALRGFRNPDGGFGHGLEPDKRCPDSLPVDVQFAFQTLVAAGPPDAGPLVGDACDWLASVAAPGGAVPVALPVMAAHPRAEHLSDWTFVPGLNPTADLAGLLHRMGAGHPWLALATGWCWSALERELPVDAHAMAGVLTFLEHVPDRERAGRVAAGVRERLADLAYFQPDPGDPEYGVTPLHFAPEPGSPWRRLFSDDAIEGHLDHLLTGQAADGGWALTWRPPSAAATTDYRSVVTVQALRVLTAYGRLTAPTPAMTR